MYGDPTSTSQYSNAQYSRDPAAAIRQRKYALAQQLQKAGMDASPTIGTGNTTPQVIARVLQGLAGTYLGSSVEGEALAASEAERAERARREALIMGLETGGSPAPPAAPAAAPMPDRIGGAPPATPEERANGGVITPQSDQARRLALADADLRSDIPPEQGGTPPLSQAAFALQRQQESGGDPNARNPRSTATGADQFIRGTWLEYARANPDRFQGLDEAGILARRTDPAESARATQWYAGQNQGALREAGLPAGPGETTLAHRFGGAGAVAALRADPNAPAAQVFGEAVMRANPDLTGKTVGQVVQQYQQRYAGSTPQPTPPGGVAARTGGVDVAGPGAPPAPQAAPAVVPGQRTPEQLRQAAAQITALTGSPARAQALYQQADALERRQLAADAERRRAGERDIDNRRADEQLALAKAAAARDAANPPMERVRQPDGSTRLVPRSEALGMTEPAPAVDTFGRANTLRDEYRALTADFRTVQTAYQNIRGAARSNTGAGDMSMLYSYVKMLDPGSVVRESEFATAAASGSFGERVQGAVQRVISGERLPESLRSSFVSEARNLFSTQRRTYDQVSNQYRSLAERNRLPADDVVTDFITPEPPEPAGGQTAPVRVASPEAAMRLPRGTPITLPDGSTGVVP